MHQVPISTTYVSSVMLWPKKLEIRKNVKTVKEHVFPAPPPQVLPNYIRVPQMNILHGVEKKT
jgi:hypothetical protein